MRPESLFRLALVQQLDAFDPRDGALLGDAKFDPNARGGGDRLPLVSIYGDAAVSVTAAEMDAGTATMVVAAVSKRSSSGEDDPDKVEPLFSKVKAIEDFIETGGSLVASSLLTVAQVTTRPLLHILVLFVCFQAWVAIDYYLRVALSWLPTAYNDWVSVYCKISRFIAYTLIFTFVNYTMAVIASEGNSGRLNVAEAGTLVALLLILGYSFVQAYASWPRCQAACGDRRSAIKSWTPAQEMLVQHGVPAAGPR